MLLKSIDMGPHNDLRVFIKAASYALTLALGVCLLLPEVGCESSSAVPAGNQTSTTSPVHQYSHSAPAKSFPAWLIGVIVLTCLGVLIVIATIVQRIMRRRENRMDQYRMGTA
ncbi:hypothetical protein MAR_038366 [Mya arenaria]|uniref:Uncharacterized protein n=1 Tax=Mya arenaria TaxID=6604 RepID=A0ABY7FRA5_MYAAR|nr:uncharacterized protein LOC128214853 [Mya arenaria]WAR24697.1 hypothetical protein MAR_038366 [Mya arenaria]